MIITKDIAKAIKKEEEYLYHKVELLDNTANIYEYLAEAGYDDINEFRNDETVSRVNATAKISTPANELEDIPREKGGRGRDARTK